MPLKELKPVSREDASHNLFGRGGPATTALKFQTGFFDSFEQSLAATVRETALQNLDERFLFLNP